MNYIDFFSNLDFNPDLDLEAKSIVVEEASLAPKLNNSVFYYKSPNNTNTSFYLITSSLNEIEFESVRKYIWNKNDADLIFYYPTKGDGLKILYAKYSPKTSLEDSTIEFFSTTEKDQTRLQNIKHWQFDSGAFWFNYYSFFNKAKQHKSIDKELVSTLSALKNKLNDLLLTLITDDKKRDETVQALIDRTLYIKYLEDNHIINSYFYHHYFHDETLNYKTLLENKSKKRINKLYGYIHEIFNNSLFDKPKINEEYLTANVCELIANSFKSDIKTGQLRLYDFQFDVLPIEFISYIYEIFLSDKQKENGIYYTPKKLSQLIIDDVIKEDKIGPILDPSCGSGMFLIVGYQRLLEIAQKKGDEPQNSIEKIEYRTKLLADNIFGIEKELIAQRFTLFSLSLQIFNGINPSEIKEFIASELKENKKINLFSKYSFSKNIKHANSLNTAYTLFEGIAFSYIVGNPPFFNIKNTDEFKDEISFLNSYQVAMSNETKKIAKDIVGHSQISQCFFLKIKDWSNPDTRFGFVSNSSNFYNDKSEVFQEYFYSNYRIEKIYELSRVKKILFEKAKESVVSIIFNNQQTDKNVINYYPVDLGLFSEKPFELLVIQDDKVIEIAQDKLRDRKVRLRDYLIGNKYDNLLIEKLTTDNFLEDYLQGGNKPFLHRGIEVVGFKEVKKEFNINKAEWSSLTQQQKNNYYFTFRNTYSSLEPTNKLSIPFIKPANINKFRVNSYDSYLGDDISMFHRPRNRELFEGKRIIWSRLGNSLKAVYLSSFIYFDFDLYVLKLENESYYELITAILNSDLISYFSNISLRKRIDSSFPKIGINDVKKIPIPKELDEDLVNQISKISKELTDGKCDYEERKNELNELIYSLYELSYWEKQRINDYFLPKSRFRGKKGVLNSYKNTIKDILEFYLKNPLIVEESSTDLNLIVVKVSFNSNASNPDVITTRRYLLNEIFEQNPNANFLASQEMIFGNDCVYIIKDDINTSWTETKAFEDAQDILKHLIPNLNE